jgi:rare lipoprotein A
VVALVGVPGHDPAPAESAPTAAAAPLPAVAVQGTPAPGRLWIDCGGFGQYTYANQLSARLTGFGADIVTPADGGEARFVVRIGPIPSVAEADALLGQVIQAGVAGAKLVVE